MPSASSLRPCPRSARFSPTSRSHPTALLSSHNESDDLLARPLADLDLLGFFALADTPRCTPK
ncbi:hypothetical protein [Nocardia sp. NPDC046763]|uniref:hypothetical protein n=1 Tax=Nocardia sp. NPDC046763 TaxID=3155256 RepID=UPI00340E520F